MCDQLDAWVFTNKMQAVVDGRIARTHAACPDYVRSTLRAFQLTGSIKGADCLRFITEAGKYWFHETLPGPQQKVWDDALEFLAALLHATCDADDPEAITTLKELKLKTTRALCCWARDVPKTEHTIVIHELVHICDMVYRWNNVRNFWCFMTERFVGYIIGFIHNRDKVEMGILLGYACTKLAYAAPPARINDIRLDREQRFGVSTARKGFLMTADALLDSKLTVGGSGNCFARCVILEHTTPYNR